MALGDLLLLLVGGECAAVCPTKAAAASTTLYWADANNKHEAQTADDVANTKSVLKDGILCWLLVVVKNSVPFLASQSKVNGSMERCNRESRIRWCDYAMQTPDIIGFNLHPNSTDLREKKPASSTHARPPFGIFQDSAQMPPSSSSTTNAKFYVHCLRAPTVVRTVQSNYRIRIYVHPAFAG